MKFDCHYIYRLAKQALNPPPEYKDAEIVQFVGVDGMDVICCFDTEEELDKYNSQRGEPLECVKLVGSFKRKIKSKVKRREEISRPREFMGPIQDHQSFPNFAKFYAEWEE